MASDNIRLPLENLYSNSYILEYEDSVNLLKRTRIKSSGRNPNDRVHHVIEQESIWNIAAKYYGNSKWWWVIADVNLIENPFELPIGDVINIPDLASVIANL